MNLSENLVLAVYCKFYEKYGWLRTVAHACTDARQGTLAAGHYSRGNQMLVLELEYQCLELHLVDFSVMDQRALLVFQAIPKASFYKSMTGAVLWS